MLDFTPGYVLAQAFHHDPMFVFIEPDHAQRRRVLPRFFAAAARLGSRHGVLDVEPGAAAAIWLTPGRTQLGPLAIFRSGLAAMPFVLGVEAWRRFVALTNAFEAAGDAVHGHDYWHLFILGVHPAHQGEGVGGRLIGRRLREADAAGQPCYLETTQPDNLPFYLGHGFRVAGHHRPPGGLPEFYTMLRPAATPPRGGFPDHGSTHKSGLDNAHQPSYFGSGNNALQPTSSR